MTNASGLNRAQLMKPDAMLLGALLNDPEARELAGKISLLLTDIVKLETAAVVRLAGQYEDTKKVQV